MRSRSRGAMRPRLDRSSRPMRAQGRPGARCTRGLVCKSAQKNAHEHTGTDGAARHSLRSGFTAYTELSPETNSSCLRRRRIEGLSKPGWVDVSSAGLTPATGARTTRLCRTQLPSPNHPTSHLRPAEILAEALSAVRLHAVDRSRKTALRTCLRARRCRVDRTPSQRFVTIAIRPS